MKNNSNIPHTLICTVGTSLFYPNLSSLPTDETTYQNWITKQPQNDRPFLSWEFISQLKTAWTSKNCQNLGQLLATIPDTIRINGAEINSIADLLDKQYCTPNCLLVFCYSDTKDGEQIAQILAHYYQSKSHQVELLKTDGLQDENPRDFRTKGLRNLAKKISQTIRDRTAPFCAINATGGYKAQIAVGVLMGQALGVPVYYKHERFSEIIAFPPMPIALDFNLWLEKSGWLNALDTSDMIPWSEIEEDWDEKMEPLVEREEINGQDYLELSPTGQIFHETFKGRFNSDRDQILPPPVPVSAKQKVSLTEHNWLGNETQISNFLTKIINEVPYVRSCRTHYWNPDLSQAVLFRLKADQIEGIFSNGSWTVKFIVETSANTLGQKAACIADLNDRLKNWRS